MGLIEAAKETVSSLLGDQWREYFYCDSLSDDVLVIKGQKRVKKGSNTKGSDNVISNGSIIAVNEGQCMIIVDQGEIIEFCANPGQYIYDTSSEATIFYGELEGNIKSTVEGAIKRFSFGGDTAKDQRVYYFNIKEINGNLFGTTNPVPFRVVDTNIGLDVDIAIRCNGEYTFKIIDPIIFYRNVCANVSDRYEKSDITRTMKAELLTALQPAFAKISAAGVRYSAVAAHTTELTEALKAELSEKWSKQRGIEMVSFAINSMKASEEDEQMIKDLQKTAVLRNSNMAAATLVGAQADAMKAAASNTATGPMMAFANMNMATQAGGMNAQQLYAMGGQQQNAQPADNNTMGFGGGIFQKPAAPVLGWTCICGKGDNRGKFCEECGAKKPEMAGWTCTCGKENTGKFCPECGAKKPEGAPLYKCDKCGWEPEDPKNPPKFCPECGDVFDESDVK
ncbi:MAG: SPFH domain-containing protein [Lachnospiraceae bacterium]|nr:SPFH domain-containing protein [Lachnospiraceae bacterium]